MNRSKAENNLKLAILAILGLSVSMGVVQAQPLVVNKFDAAGEVGQWRFDFGGVGHTAVFDPTLDANGNAASGSMRVALTFNSSLGGNNQGAYTTDRWFPAINGAPFTSLQFDVRVDPDSAPDAFGNNGYFVMAIRNTDNYNYIVQFGDNVKSADGWRHVSVPLTAPFNQMRALTFNLYGGPNQNIDGDVTFNIDNIILVPEPSTMALFGLGALGAFAIRRRTASTA